MTDLDNHDKTAAGGDGPLTDYQKGFMAGWDEAVRIFPALQSKVDLLPDPVPQAAPMRNSWPEIDSELTAYIQTIRAQLIEECAKEATRCDTHALFCMADPTAIRQDIASRIRSLSLSRPQSRSGK